MSDDTPTPPKASQTQVIVGAFLGAAIAIPITIWVLDNALIGFVGGAVIGAGVGGTILAPFIGKRRDGDR